MLELMADEWHTALKAYSFELVHEAVGVLIGSRRFWPVIADVRGACEALLQEAFMAGERQKAEEDARRRAERIADPFEAFSVGVYNFMKRTDRRCSDFRNAGCRTVTGIIGLEFDTQADVDMIAARYGADLDQEFGFHVPLTWATVTPATEWVHPKWKKTAA